MTLIQTTIDLEDGIEDIDEELQDVEEARADFKEVLNEEYDSYTLIPPELEQKWEQLNEQRKNLIGQKRVLERVCNEEEEHYWGGTEIQISELSGGQLATVQDDIEGAANRAGMKGQDMNGGRVVAFLQESVIATPPDAPPNPRDWPWLLMLYVFDKVNNFNSVGDTDFQEESLKEAMES